MSTRSCTSPRFPNPTSIVSRSPPAMFKSIAWGGSPQCSPRCAASSLPSRTIRKSASAFEPAELSDRAESSMPMSAVNRSYFPPSRHVARQAEWRPMPC